MNTVAILRRLLCVALTLPSLSVLHASLCSGTVKAAGEIPAIAERAFDVTSPTYGTEEAVAQLGLELRQTLTGPVLQAFADKLNALYSRRATDETARDQWQSKRVIPVGLSESTVLSILESYGQDSLSTATQRFVVETLAHVGTVRQFRIGDIAWDQIPVRRVEEEFLKLSQPEREVLLEYAREHARRDREHLIAEPQKRLVYLLLEVLKIQRKPKRFSLRLTAREWLVAFGEMQAESVIELMPHFEPIRGRLVQSLGKILTSAAGMKESIYTPEQVGSLLTEAYNKRIEAVLRQLDAQDAKELTITSKNDSSSPPQKLGSRESRKNSYTRSEKDCGRKGRSQVKALDIVTEAQPSTDELGLLERALAEPAKYLSRNRTTVVIDWEKAPREYFTRKARESLSKMLLNPIPERTLRKLDLFLELLRERKSSAKFTAAENSFLGLQPQHRRDSRYYRIGDTIRLFIGSNDIVYEVFATSD